MKSKTISNKEKNAIYDAPNGTITCIGFQNYLTMSTQTIEFKIISRIDILTYVLQNITEKSCDACEEILFKIKIVSDKEIEVIGSFGIQSFMQGRIPEEEYFRKGLVLWVVSDEGVDWKYNYSVPTASDIDCNL